MPDVPITPEMEERLRLLEQRASQAKVKHDATRVPDPKTSTFDRESTRGVGIGLSIAYAICGAPLVCMGIGYILDDMVGGGGTLFRILGFLVGGIGGIAYAVKVSSRV